MASSDGICQLTGAAPGFGQPIFRLARSARGRAFIGSSSFDAAPLPSLHSSERHMNSVCFRLLDGASEYGAQ
jgi:hypothetical protein